MDRPRESRTYSGSREAGLSGVPSAGHSILSISPAQAEIRCRGCARPKGLRRGKRRSVARTEPASVLGAKKEGHRSRTLRRWGAAPGLLPILWPEPVALADQAQALS